MQQVDMDMNKNHPHQSRAATAVLFCLSLMQAGFARPQQVYKSPNGRLRAAVVIATRRTRESRIEIRIAKGKQLLAESFASPDGDHGRVVEHAAWTANSRFFVLSTTSSGGHSPWHDLTYFYDRRRNKLFCLDDFIGAVTTSEFILVTPDIIRTRILVNADMKGKAVTVKLSRIQVQKPLK